MRVLQLGPYPPPHGGVQTNLVAIRSFLLKRGVPCAVINITRHRKPNADEVYYPENPYQLVKLLGCLEYDLIHLHIGGMLTMRLLSLAWICAARPGKKSVLTFHSGGFPSTPEGQALGPTSFAGFVMRRFDGLIAVNSEILNFFLRLGAQPQRARLISPYAFIANDSTAEPLQEPLEAFFANHSPVMISVGLLEPEYDLPLQIEVLPRVREHFPNAGLLLIGSGSLESALRSLIAASPCQQYILLAGDVPHALTMQAVSRANLMLRTTLYDGDALSIREALQLGTPVIASDNGMRPDGVILVPKSDAGALLRAIQQELERPIERKQMASPDESNIQSVLDFYQDIMNGKTR